MASHDVSSTDLDHASSIMSCSKPDEDAGSETEHLDANVVVILSNSLAEFEFASLLQSQLRHHYSVFLSDKYNWWALQRKTVDNIVLIVVVLSEEYMSSEYIRELLFFLAHSSDRVSEYVRILPIYYNLLPSDLKNQEDLKRWHNVRGELYLGDFYDYCGDVRDHLSDMTGIIFNRPLENEVDLSNKIAAAIYNLLPIIRDRLCKIIDKKFDELLNFRFPFSVLGMYGPPGSGKSSLCCRLINYYNNSPLFSGRVLYLNFPSNPTAAQLVESYKPLLTLCDIDNKEVQRVSDLEQVYYLLKQNQPLKNSPFFLVVDNISSDEAVNSVQDFLWLQFPFFSRSRVLLVARTLKLLSPILCQDIEMPAFYGHPYASISVPSLNEEEASQILVQSANGAGVNVSELPSRQRDIVKKAIGMIGCCHLNEALVYLPLVLKLVGEHMRSLDWENAEISESFWEKIDQCKEEVVRKLMHEELEQLCTERLKVLSSDVAFCTILHMSIRNLSVIEVALQLLNFMRQGPQGSAEKELESLERHCFSVQPCSLEINLLDLYHKLITSDLKHRTCFVLSGEHSAIMSCVEMLHIIASRRSEGGLIAIDLRKLLYCLKSSTKQVKKKETFVYEVTNLQGPDSAGDNILLILWVKPMIKGMPKSNDSFPGQFFNGFRLAVDYLQVGKFFRLVSARYSVIEKGGGIPNVPSEESCKDASSVEPRVEVRTLDEIRVCVLLDHIFQNHRIVVGALYHSVPSEGMEFFFSTPEDMAACVGVGLPQAKVLLNNDLSVIIHELEDHDWNSQAALWKPILSDEKSQLIMQLDGMSTQPTEASQLQMSEVESGKSLSRKHGVGFDDGIFHYIGDTSDASGELRWPLLYEIALCIMTERIARQCPNDTSTANSGSNEAPELSDATSSNSSMLQNLADKCKREPEGDGGGGGGSGDRDEGGCTSHVAVGADEDAELTVVVYPLELCHVLTREGLVESITHCHGLENATIAPELEFVFCRKPGSKHISMKAVSPTQLETQLGVLDDANYFGWYHNNISISLSCVHVQAHPGTRVVILKAKSSKLCNPPTHIKHSRGKTTTSSTADTIVAGGQAAAKLSAPGVAQIELKGASSGSTTQEAARGSDEKSEEDFAYVCNGFLFEDLSRKESPASASFRLYHPEIENVNDIWDSKILLRSKGVFQKIEPEIEGTWIPLNQDYASPYLFTTGRHLKLHQRRGSYVHPFYDLKFYQRPDSDFHYLKQEYSLKFYINHAMNHLTCQKLKVIELLGDQEEVPNVLRMSSSRIVEV